MSIMLQGVKGLMAIILDKQIIASMTVGTPYTFFDMLYVAWLAGMENPLRLASLRQKVEKPLDMMDRGPIAPVILIRIHNAYDMRSR